MEHAIVAVIGAGTMGSAMVRRLLGQGHPVWVWNRDPEPLRALAAAGAEVTSDSRRAVSGAPVVLAVLPTAAAVTEVILDGGVLEGMEQEAVLAQMGTIGVAATLSLDAAVRDRRPDVMFVDVPVSGSKAPAERGELLLLGSGPG
ncbi:MAG TPA: NAD(P)-binding domain-containing protein [Acidimicrobiales bacterium]|nr:NAD(P)-binding domain-containing protein [Acidimicrobiales bacterium]